MNEVNEVDVFHAQLALSKPIIRPWEEVVPNMLRTRLGYDKKVSFFIPNYSKPMQFQSVGFLNEISSSDLHEILKCQHCDKVGHMKDHCFNLHPCMHFGKHTHCSTKCFLLKKSKKKKMKSARKDIPYVVAYTGDGSLFVVDILFLTGGNE